MPRGTGTKSIRVTYANAASTLALIVALGTSGAYAATKIGSSDIKRNVVLSKHIKKDEVKQSDIADGAVKEEQIADSAVSATKIACKGNSPADKMVKAGSVCIDKYENSLWREDGTRITGSPNCSPTGQNCDNIYARSVKGVEPNEFVTWFQAQRALANSGKRLPTNAEWQLAAAGTPDGAPCNVSSSDPVDTGANFGCRSAFDAHDMVGNVNEWVADWLPRQGQCLAWDPTYSDDAMCLNGSSNVSPDPDALLRGGGFRSGTDAGPLAIEVDSPLNADVGFGFRGAR